MPLTTTATWPELIDGKKATASEVEAKFDWLEGDQLPMVDGNLTTSVYNVGSSTYRWNVGYFNEINAASLVTTASIPADEVRATFKAWGIDIQSAGTLTAQFTYNISSVSLLTTGTYRVSWTTPFATNTYSVITMPKSVSTIARIGTVDNFTTTSADLYFFTSTGGLSSPTRFDVSATGDQ